MNIDWNIKLYLEWLVNSAYPQLAQDQYLVAVEGGDADYGSNYRDGVVCRESINATVMIMDESFVDRVALVRRFVHDRVEIDEYDVEQMYMGFRRFDYVEVTQMKAIKINFRFIVDIKEDV